MWVGIVQYFILLLWCRTFSVATLYFAAALSFSGFYSCFFTVGGCGTTPDYDEDEDQLEEEQEEETGEINITTNQVF